MQALLHFNKDRGVYYFLDQPRYSVLWFAMFDTEEAAWKAWASVHPSQPTGCHYMERR